MSTSGGGVHAVLGNTTTPDEALNPCTPGWHGTVAVRRSPRELTWPVSFLGVPPIVAVASWFITGDPVDMVLTAVLAFAVMAFIDLRRPRHRG